MMDIEHEVEAGKARQASPGVAIDAPASSGAALPPLPAIGSVEEFDRLVADVERAAHEWGVRPQSKEARYVSALLASTRWMGRLSEGYRSDMRALLQAGRDAAGVELRLANEITKAATVALQQARNAQVAMQVEKEALMSRMIGQTLPMFADKLQKLLVLKERGLNLRAQWLRYAGVVVLTLAVFGGGYSARQMQELSGADAIARCLAHPLSAQGHLYCDVANLTAVPSVAQMDMTASAGSTASATSSTSAKPGTTVK